MFHWLKWQPHVPQAQSPLTERFHGGLAAQRAQADARIFWLVIAQWAAILICSFALAGRWKHLRLETLSSVVISVGIFSLLPLVMVLRSPGSWLSRWTVVLSQGAISSVLWSASGGRPDTYLHLFAWLVVLAMYRDVPALATAVATALVGQILMTVCIPAPAGVAEPAQWFADLAWMAVLMGETALLSAFVLLDRQSLAAQIQRELALESLQADFQLRVAEINRNKNEERDALKRELATLTERLTTAETARYEISREFRSLRRDVANQATAILKLASRPVDTSLTRDWRAQWQSLRQQSQQLMRLVDLPSLDSSSAEQSAGAPSHATLSRLKEHRSARADSRKRAMLLMRNPLQQAKAITALEIEGYTVEVVPNGPRTYYSAMLNEYSLIVIDVDLPGDEGYDTLEALQLLPPEHAGRAQRILAATGELTPDRILRCTNLGVDGMLNKPLQADALHEALAGATDDGQLQSHERGKRNDSRPRRSSSGSAIHWST